MRRTTLIVLALPFLALASGAQASTALATKSGCLSCHHATQKRIGPAFQAIADKYKGNAAAAGQLASKVKAGGTGVWGKIPMPANKAVSDADAKTLVTWILAGGK